jgi:hypothetical protein
VSGPFLASIVISSYNYGGYLREAIDSATGQTHPHTEVIVVDDGSTDDSREIIAGYGGRITSVLKENGGQASALNAGLKASRGEVLFFLDSDDVLRPTAVEQAVELFRDPAVVKVHWPLVAIDGHGRETGRLIPGPDLPEGDLREAVIRDGPYGYMWPDTSGNAWARSFLERIFPLPEAEYRTAPDLYLSAFAPLFGAIRRISAPQAHYRDHGRNHRSQGSFEERVREGLWRERHCLDALATHCRSVGVPVEPGRWKASSWWHQIHEATEEILASVPPGDTFILADEDHWGIGDALAGRWHIPFLEPSDDASAIGQLEQLREAGARFMIFGWPYLWWLDCYPGFHTCLRSRFRCLAEKECVVIFDLRVPR